MASERRWSRRDWATMAIAASVVVLIAAVIAGAIAVMGGDSDTSKVVLAPASESGTDPFTTSVASGAVIALRPSAQAKVAATRRAFVTDPATHTLFATGTTPGLYGGSG